MRKALNGPRLPFLQEKELAIAIGFQISAQSNSLLCQHYCGWCLFLDQDQRFDPASVPKKWAVGLVIVNSAIEEKKQKVLIRRLRRLKIKAPVRPVGGIVALESLLRHLFWPRVGQGLKGPLSRPVFVKPEAKEDLIPVSLPSEPVVAEQVREVVFTDPLFPVTIERDEETNKLHLVLRGTRVRVAEALGLATLNGMSDEQVIERILDKMTAIRNRLRLVKSKMRKRIRPKHSKKQKRAPLKLRYGTSVAKG